MLGVDAIDAERAADRLRYPRLVTGDERDVPDPGLAQARHQTVCIGAQLIADQRDPGGGTVDGDQHLRVTVHLFRQDRLDAMLGKPPPAADEHMVAADVSFDSAPERLDDIVRNLEPKPVRLGAGDERLRERMRREPIDARREPQRLRRRDPVQRQHPIQLRPAERHRARLVQQHRACLAELLDRRRALDHDARARAAREPRDQRDRRRQDQRARSRDHEHRQRAYGIARCGPRHPCNDDSDRQEEGRVAIGESHERGALDFPLPPPGGRAPRTCSPPPLEARSTRTPRPRRSCRSEHARRARS